MIVILAGVVAFYVLVVLVLWAMARAAAIGDARLAEQLREHARRR